MVRSLLALLAVLIATSTSFAPSPGAKASTPQEAAREASPLADDRAAALRWQQHNHYLLIQARERAQQAERDNIADLVPEQYRALVIEIAGTYDLAPRLIAAVGHVESRWDPAAVGADGDAGLMQIMPATAAWIAQEMGMNSFDLYDPATNVAFGAWYLRHLIDAQGSTEAALAAYNGGPAWETRAPTVARSYAERVRSVKNGG